MINGDHMMMVMYHIIVIKTSSGMKLLSDL